MVNEQANSVLNNYAPDFELPGIDEQVHHLTKYLENFQAIGVVFMSDNCPQVRLYLDRLKQIQAEFENRGFTLIGINANDPEKSPQDSLEQMKIFAQQQNLNFPYIRDTAQDVANCFGAKITPEVFLLDKNSAIRYRGLIDDSPKSLESVQSDYFRNSITALLEGKEIAPRRTEAVGSSIEWRQQK